MKRRTEEIQVFSVSFLDLLSCGLGSVLLLLLIVMEQSQRASADAKTQVKTLRETVHKMEKAQTTLIGINEDVKNVVFIFDTSTSMKTPRFEEHCAFLNGWIENLAFTNFNVVRFSDHAEAFSPSSMLDGTDENRRAAMKFVDAFEPYGNTNSLEAFSVALKFRGIDTIILFSDGSPAWYDETGQYVAGKPAMERVKEYLRLEGVDVTINTVAMGQYFKEDYGEFLQSLASEHNGMFIGR